MKLTLPRWGLPLLTKELVEQAARRRTYVVRVVYATLLFFAGFMFYYSIVARYDASPYAVLGHGRELFQAIVNIQFVGIYLFAPAMTCGAITFEKERNTLGLLFLTRLGPWAILLEKYLGRIIPMCSFLILSLPLLVIAYSLGGFTQQYVWTGVWLLLITVLQVSSLALLCSAFFRTTVASFIASYVLGAVMLFFLPVFDGVFHLGLEMLPASLGWSMNSTWWLPWIFCTPAIFERAEMMSPAVIVIASCPILLLTMLLLLLSRFFLVRRAFLTPANLVLRIFKTLDTFFTRLNQNRLTRGIILVKDSTSLPTLMEPVAWRETTKTTLGAFRYLVRLLLVIETPVVVICILLVAAEGGIEPIGVLMILLWILSILIVSVKATTLVGGERSHETLDVLLTTPMHSTEIVRQKCRGVWRLMMVLSVPLLTTAAFKTWFVVTAGAGRLVWRPQDVNGVLYLFCSVLAVAIYLPMVAWLSLLIGIRVRAQSRAIFSALAVIVVWCVVPVFVVVMILDIMNVTTGRGPTGLLLLLSPSTIIPLNEFFELEELWNRAELVAVLLNFTMYGLLMVLFRNLCLRDLDRHLGRAEAI